MLYQYVLTIHNAGFQYDTCAHVHTRPFQQCFARGGLLHLRSCHQHLTMTSFLPLLGRSPFSLGLLCVQEGVRAWGHLFLPTSFELFTSGAVVSSSKTYHIEVHPSQSDLLRVLIVCMILRLLDRSRVLWSCFTITHRA